MTTTPTGVLPAEFTAAAHAMSTAFTTGTDEECEAAAGHLTGLLHGLDSDLTAAADQLLTTLAAAAAAERAAARVAAQLAGAVTTGVRPVDAHTEVRTLRLADGTEVAVVVPTGSGPAQVAARSALLSGTCPDCTARLRGDWQVHHAEGCVTAT